MLHTATKIEQNWKAMMIVFGGERNFEGNAYALNLETMEWIKLDNIHYLRVNHTANIYEGNIVLFGGEAYGRKNDIQVYNSRKKTLKTVETEGDPPTPRVGHGTAISGNVMYVFGGMYERVILNDLHSYDLTSK